MTQQRYFSILEPAGSGGRREDLLQLKCYIDGEWKDSASTAPCRDAYNPSTGEVIAKVPQCTIEELDAAVAAAKAAYPAWSQTPVRSRVQILFRMKALLDQHLDELTLLLCREQGKTWAESRGDIVKAIEVTEFACGMPQLMKGESIMNVSKNYDTVLYREPIGVFLGLVPWNFPAMIPHGWMIPLCIAAGNTFVLKAATNCPQSAMRFMELWEEAGLPKGVINVVTANTADVEHLVKHPDIVGVSFVGSTSVGMEIYRKAAEAGKRVQCLGEAKNHALVLADAHLERSAAGIINAFCGCAGQRCMALPVVVAEESIADRLVELLVKLAGKLKVGCAYLPETELGPVVNARQRQSIVKWIDKGIAEGATLVLDGRSITVPGYENGYFLGPTILDHVTEEMSVGTQEIFGPVLCIKRVRNFDEGLELMNRNPFANGSVIYTSSGYYGRKFAFLTHGGQVGINVGIPVPMCIFGFTGHKKSFIGDLHVMGTDGVRFYTESKNVTSTWFTEETQIKVDTWDGMLAR
ncbi:MAG: CoA-acylating methylmalonate-semialdehyde dehydrogenase [Desulfovibrionaceae bacterium]|nr:CoA-acylating methylmalonate-semialdehyde dehydrogenase [Desulfovibrionaceae bacterium]